MNRTYIDEDPIMDTQTIINIQSDGFDATLTISYKTGFELDKEYRYSGTRVCFHRLVKTITSLYERGNYDRAGLYEQALEDLLAVQFSDTELEQLSADYKVNNLIDLVSALLKEGAFNT